MTDAGILEQISDELKAEMEDALPCDIEECTNTADWIVYLTGHQECWGTSLICNTHRFGYAAWVVFAALSLFGIIEGDCPKCGKHADARELTWEPVKKGG